MNQEDKELLLVDLCARLPYGVICHWRIGSELTLNLTEYNGLLTCINKVKIEGNNEFYWDCYFDCNDSDGNSFQNEDVSIEIVKPYLRPMSSMTEEERKEYNEYLFHGASIGLMSNTETAYELIDWLNAHHFDYRGLIEMGLAIAVTEENNPYKE